MKHSWVSVVRNGAMAATALQRKNFFICHGPAPQLSSHARTHGLGENVADAPLRQAREQDVLRWHGRIGNAETTVSAMHRDYRVALQGIPLDSGDSLAIHARLSGDDWAFEQVRSVVIRGVWPGRGQLWSPDPAAAVTAVDDASDAPVACRLRRELCISTSLTRTELFDRLQHAFAAERLIEVVIATETD
ncbi:hypothetical protein [Tahibacter aquaticus]|uniref:hypothetical protein n=1 Tax=Tahibacter aquaticus TaxID=520092 RepID=UPI00106042AC|nr:hypothetical protein [Tahibacter aquaticus]